MKQILTLVATALCALAADPFVGTWKPVQLDQWKFTAATYRPSRIHELQVYVLNQANQYEQIYLSAEGNFLQSRVLAPLDGVGRKSRTDPATTNIAAKISAFHWAITRTSPKGTNIVHIIVTPDGRFFSERRTGKDAESGAELDGYVIYEKLDDAPAAAFLGTWGPTKVDQWKLSTGTPESAKSSKLTWRFNAPNSLVFVETAADGTATPDSIWDINGKPRVGNRAGNTPDRTYQIELVDAKHLRGNLKSNKGQSAEDFVISPDGSSITRTRRGTRLSTGAPIDEIFYYTRETK